jgi:signal transduction histidine kinase/ActR/RegA family two-component response regulator
MLTALILALAFLDSILGAVARDYWIVALSSLCGLISVALIAYDFSATEALLKSTLEGAEKRGSAFSAVSSIGKRIVQRIEALRYRSQTLAWEVGALVRTSPRMQAQSSGELISTEDRSISRGLEEVYASFASRLRRDFRHTALAIGDQNRILFSDRMEGGRFEQAFQQFFWPLFKGKSRSMLGLYDGFIDSRAFGSFGEFNIRWSLSASFYSGEREIAVWLGYQAERGPTETEQLRFSACCEDLAGEIRIAEERVLYTSQARDAEKRSQQSTRMIAEISHDIRSPLSNIKAVLNVLKLEGMGIDTPHLLQVAESNCLSMSEILESLIDFSRLQSGTLAPRTEEVSLSQIVEAVVQSFEATARLKGVELIFETAPQMLEISIDRIHLRRMLANLISNALKYTDQGRVTVRLERNGPHASISVSDTGRGMTAAQLEQLFTPFSRFHTEMAEGIGLGLALTRSLAELNHAELSVVSQPSEGSTFSIQLKNPVRALDTNLQRDLRSVAEPQLRRIKVLVVDDNRDSVDTLSRSLELRGLEVLRANSVTEALYALGSVAKETPLDVMISDVQMPKGGIEALLAHRALMEAPPAVIVLSGSSTSSQRLLKAGVRRVMLKPADLNEVIGEIERAVVESAGALGRAA